MRRAVVHDIMSAMFGIVELIATSVVFVPILGGAGKMGDRAEGILAAPEEISSD